MKIHVLTLFNNYLRINIQKMKLGFQSRSKKRRKNQSENVPKIYLMKIVKLTLRKLLNKTFNVSILLILFKFINEHFQNKSVY